jgi:L-ribulokinase
MSKYSVGLDFGTNSCRCLIADINNGNELSTNVFNYPSGESGVIIDQHNPNLARQNPADYLLAIEVTIKEAVKKAKNSNKNFSPDKIIGIGVDTTGSSPIPVDEKGTPLCFYEKFKSNSAAMVWLWKDHTSHVEAQLITELAAKEHPEYLSKIGGIYSSEWFWSKILHCEKEDPEVFNSAYSFVEICDWIPSVLTGDTKPQNLKRSICAAGHKAMYNGQWGGLPESNFLEKLSPRLGELRDRINYKAFPSEEKVGFLSKEWADKLGLTTNVSVAVGAFDAHIGAVGAGIKEGTLVKILGTSTCDIMISPNNKQLADIPGVCGIVNESVMKGYFGIEAGQSAVGDIFLWFINNLVSEKYGNTQDEKFFNLERLFIVTPCYTQ